MRNMLRLKWLRAVTPVAVVATALATLIPAAPSAAASGSKVYSATFNVSCVLGPGSLNVAGTVTATLSATGPTAVSNGDTVSLTNGSSSITTPGNWSTSFAAIGAATAGGAITSFDLGATGLSAPNPLNIATLAPYGSGGLPWGPVNVVSGQPLSFSAPNTGSLTIGPYTVTGANGTNMVIQTAGGNGSISATATGYDSSGNAVVGPLPVSCNPPATPVVLGSVPIAAVATSTTTSSSSSSSSTATSTSTSTSKSTSTSTSTSTSKSTSTSTSSSTHTTTSSTATSTSTSTSTPTSTTTVTSSSTSAADIVVKFNNWTLSGYLSDKALGQTINLPKGATFNGSADLTSQSIAGDIAIPSFSASVKIFGFLPTQVGLTMTESAPVSGSIGPDPNVTGNLLVNASAKVNIYITAVGILGINIPTTCETSSPVVFPLKGSYPSLQLTTGATFTGTTTLPSVRCGGILGGLLSPVLTALFSGPGNAYSMSIAPAAATTTTSSTTTTTTKTSTSSTASRSRWSWW